MPPRAKAAVAAAQKAVSDPECPRHRRAVLHVVDYVNIVKYIATINDRMKAASDAAKAEAKAQAHAKAAGGGGAGPKKKHTPSAAEREALATLAGWHERLGVWMGHQGRVILKMREAIDARHIAPEEALAVAKAHGLKGGRFW
jgi:hypothetical protein